MKVIVKYTTLRNPSTVEIISTYIHISLKKRLSYRFQFVCRNIKLVEQ